MGIGWNELGRGLVAGMLERQVTSRGSLARWVGIVMMVVGFILAIGFGGFVRGLAITILLLGLIIVLLVALLRALALGAIRKFATPTSLAEKREVIDHAMERADLPTGPIGIVRFLVRLRRGVGSEVRRLDTVLDELRDDLAMSEEMLAPEEAEAAGELETGPRSEPTE